jgi:hypothetical protein
MRNIAPSRVERVLSLMDVAGTASSLSAAEL